MGLSRNRLETASKQDIRFPSYESGDSMLFFNCVWDYPEICLELLQSRLSDFLQMNLEIVRCSLTVYGIFQKYAWDCFKAGYQISLV